MLPVYMGSAYIARTTQHHTRARARNKTRNEQVPETAESSEQDTREHEHNAEAEMPRQTRARRRRLHWRDAKRHEAENPLGPENETNQNRGRVRACCLHIESPSITRKRKCRGRQEHDADGYTGAMQKTLRQKTLESRKRDRTEAACARAICTQAKRGHNAKATIPRTHRATADSHLITWPKARKT